MISRLIFKNNGRTLFKESVKFTKSFTRQSPLPADSVLAATKVMLSADLHRYQSHDNNVDEVAKLESEFAQWQGADFCLAVTSGGQALQIALRSVGVDTGTRVLTNAFTLAPVPGAIRAVGALPVLVEVTSDLVIDLDDLSRKAKSSQAKYLLLSHMRGHVVDMDKLSALAKSLSITVIEDCAHTMGATWSGVKSGNFGQAACFSTQSYKHMNSGEGGLITSKDPAVMAKAIIISGSYMNYQTHTCAPDKEYFAEARLDCPNMSARMDSLRAAILRPQLNQLNETVEKWNRLYQVAAESLSKSNLIRLPSELPAAHRVGSSLQFLLPEFDEEHCIDFLKACAVRGVELKWFGRKEPVGFTSTHSHWRYLNSQDLPQTDNILSSLFDFRIPLTFSEEDCRLLGDIIIECVQVCQAGSKT